MRSVPVTTVRFGIIDPSAAALAAARVAQVFVDHPGVDRAIVYRTRGGPLVAGQLRVCPYTERELGGVVYGVYGRDVTVGQIIEDLAE